ncbi:MAG: PKD domain-containing protein [Holophagales bacterium]|nr:PKD domain-containing protein [Holophagales bacterium]MYD20927.1 PKD domain-containing protein [Holophagales bacterium]MYI33314.1 PKD domain-containing protein [Holophagales bacterium]
MGWLKSLVTLTAGLGFSTGAAGQSLLTLDLESHSGPARIGMAATTSSTVQPVAVSVDLELVRSGPMHLDLPTPEGRILTAERTTFRDRGNGDATWVGRFPGAAYDSVVLTIVDGRLSGKFNEPLGAHYEIRATEVSGVLYQPEDQHLECTVRDKPAVVSLQGVRSTRHTDDGLKVLVLYTPTAARLWSRRHYGGSKSAFIQLVNDHISLVFRNSNLQPPELVFKAAPSWLNTVDADGEHQIDSSPYHRLLGSGEVDLLRRAHNADIVHLMHAPQVLREFAGGEAELFGTISTSHQRFLEMFAHELGHNLGGTHQPGVNCWDRADAVACADQGRCPRWQTYAYAHSWDENARPSPDGVIGTYGTAVSYSRWQEPIFSTARVEPVRLYRGQEDVKLGVSDQRENERAFQYTIGVRAAQSIEDDNAPLPPSHVAASLTGTTLRVSWVDNSDDETGFVVRVQPFRNPDAQITRLLAENEREVLIRGLSPGRHIVGVRSISDNYDDPFKEDQTWFTIPGAEPPRPTDATLEIAAVPGVAANNPWCRLVKVVFDENSTSDYSKEVQIYGPPFYFGGLERSPSVGHRPFSRSFQGVRASFGCLDGTYTFRVYNHDLTGRSEPHDLRVTHRPPPLTSVIEAQPEAIIGTAVSFDGGNSVNAEKYFWFFGDGRIRNWSTDPSAAYTYYSPGEYEVKLMVAAGDCGVGVSCRYVESTWKLVVKRPDSDEGDEPGPPDGDDPDHVDEAPTAAISSSAVCTEGLCHARTNVPVMFEDASSGTVQSRDWEFGEGRTSQDREVEHIWSEPGFYTVTLRVKGGESESLASVTFLVEASDPAGACKADTHTRCLQDSRYAVQIYWANEEGRHSRARVVRAGTNDSGMFYFFDRENWEVLIKVLDGCAFNGHVWVYGASTTDQGYSIRVEDTVTGTLREYDNEPGRAAPTITDATAFPVCNR